MVADQLQRAVHMAAGFGMERDDVGAGLGKHGHQVVHWLHHQMHPEAFIYYLPSIIRVAVINPGQWLGVVDALLRVLDRSPTHHWDNLSKSGLLDFELKSMR